MPLLYIPKSYKIAICCFLVLLYGPARGEVYASETKDMNVSATVPSKPGEYQLNITAEPRDSRIAQTTEIHYTVTYGTNLSYTTTPFILQATLLPGKVQGVAVPSLYIEDILPNAISNAYQNISPVIDLIAHTITWTIPSFPAQTTDQKVSFILKTNESYTGVDVVDFDVAMKIIAPDITVTETMSQSYLYIPPKAQPTPTPTPTVAPTKPIITSVQVSEVTKDTATFLVMTNPKTSVKAVATALTGGSTKTMTTTDLTQYHRMTISDLLPNTSYIVRFTIIDEQKQEIISDAYSIHTSLLYTPIHIDTSSLIISSLDTIFQPEFSMGAPTAPPFATLPVDTQYTFQLRIPDAKRIFRIQGIIQDSNVLGFFIDTLFPNGKMKEADASTEMVDMAELSPSIFTGTLKTKPTSGLYELRIRITDINDNVTEQYVGTVSVVQPFTVLNTQTNAPIENARIFLSRYFPKTGEYTPLSPSFVSTRNPVFTNERGESSFVLPQGTYRAVVSYLGTEKTVLFTLDNNQHSGFPVVSLLPAPLTIIGYIRYHVQNIMDVLVTNAISFGSSIGSSKRLFESIAVMIMVLLSLATLVAFSSRTLISISSIPKYLVHTIQSLIKHPSVSSYISGIVIDGNTRKAIPLADIAIIDCATNTIATLLKTDRFGHYFFKTQPGCAYEIEIRKPGYECIESIPYQPELSPKTVIHVLHTYHPHRLHSALQTIKQSVQTVFSVFFEAIIVLTLVIEVIFLRYFGIIATYPYLIASFFAVLLWVAYMHHKNISSY